MGEARSNVSSALVSVLVNRLCTEQLYRIEVRCDHSSRLNGCTQNKLKHDESQQCITVAKTNRY